MESAPVTDTENNYFNYTDIADCVADGLICLRRKYRGIIVIKFGMFHKSS